MSSTFNENGIEVVSNKKWLQKRGEEAWTFFGEQPIDVAYTIMTLSSFYDEFQIDDFRGPKNGHWIQPVPGENWLHQIVYNPCTGGCYDGLEESHVNLNQGAESDGKLPDGQVNHGVFPQKRESCNKPCIQVAPGLQKLKGMNYVTFKNNNVNPIAPA